MAVIFESYRKPWQIWSSHSYTYSHYITKILINLPNISEIQVLGCLYLKDINHWWSINVIIMKKMRNLWYNRYDCKDTEHFLFWKNIHLFISETLQSFMNHISHFPEIDHKTISNRAYFIDKTMKIKARCAHHLPLRVQLS